MTLDGVHGEVTAVYKSEIPHVRRRRIRDRRPRATGLTMDSRIRLTVHNKGAACAESCEIPCEILIIVILFRLISQPCIFDEYMLFYMYDVHVAFCTRRVVPWKSKPRNNEYVQTRALAMRCAQQYFLKGAAQIPRASMAAQATLTPVLCTRHTVAMR